MAERYAAFFEHFIDALRARPLTIEILAAEIVTRNELTAILETEREAWGEQVEALIGGAEYLRQPHLRGITLLLVAGVQYLLLRSRTIRIFGGFDLRGEEAWVQLKAAVRAMALKMLGGAPGATPAGAQDAASGNCADVVAQPRHVGAAAARRTR